MPEVQPLRPRPGSVPTAVVPLPSSFRRNALRGLLIVGALALPMSASGAPGRDAGRQMAVGANAIQRLEVANPAGADAAPGVRLAAFGREHPGADVRTIADWVSQSRDNGGAPFLIVDKRNARVFVFDADARMLGTSPVLLGAARGDDSVPGIGERKMADIRPFERTTPAGRFVAEAGRNIQGEDIIWIDYDAAVSMHRVRATNPRERRLERLATPTIADNRISWGCINVPVAFFNAHVSPVFSHGSKAVVYVLPEVHPLRDVFPSYGADQRTASADGVDAARTRRLAGMH